MAFKVVGMDTLLSSKNCCATYLFSYRLLFFFCLVKKRDTNKDPSPTMLFPYPATNSHTHKHFDSLHRTRNNDSENFPPILTPPHYSAPFPISTSLLACNLLSGVNNPNTTLLTAVSFVISSGGGPNHFIFDNFSSYSTRLNLHASINQQFLPTPLYKCIDRTEDSTYRRKKLITA